MSDKAELRRWAATLEPATAVESSRIVAEVDNVLARAGWGRVLTFLAMPGEVDLTALHGRPSTRFFITRTPARGGLTVHDLDGDLERHPLGYLQPPASAPEADLSQIDAVLVPGVLFDRSGGRLGHGKGYYDRLLRSMPQRPFLIGVTVARRVVADLPMTTTDVRMDALVTEEGYRVSSLSNR